MVAAGLIARTGLVGLIAVLAAVLASVQAPADRADAAFPGANDLLAYSETQTIDSGGIWLNDEAGTQPMRIEEASTHFPAWSPDGTKLLFTRFPDQIYVADANGANEQLIAAGGWPVWHPDGQRIVYSRNGDIYIADPPSETNLTNTPGFNEVEPVVSPDGDHIAYRNNPTNAGPNDIWVMDVNGGDQTEITRHDPAYFYNGPDWSPDGTQLVMGLAIVSLGSDIVIMDANGGNEHAITNTPARHEDNPAWSPDGTRIAFLMNRTDNNFAAPQGSPPSDIWTMDPDGTDLHNVTNGAGVTSYDEPDWQPLPAETPAIVWGDVDCDEVAGELDALALLFDEAGLGGATVSQGGECPAIGETVATSLGDKVWGDWDCSGEVDGQDAIADLAFLNGTPIYINDCIAVSAPTDGVNPLTGGVLATFDVVGQTLHLWTDRADTVQQLLDLDAGGGNPTFPIGPLLPGPGPMAYSAPYSWHFDPEEVTMTEAAIEVCDGTPSYVEQHPADFATGYCPWSAQLVSLVDLR